MGLSELYLREATIDDKDLLFEWANDPVVRRESFHSGRISYEAHSKWFGRIMSDENELQFILVSGDEKIGQARLTIEDGNAVVSYSIAPDKRGYGLGTEVIRLLQEEARKNPRIHRLVAQVKPSNIASMKCFEKSGFTEEYRQYSIDLVRCGGYSRG